MMEVTAAVIWQEDKFLICQRPREKYCGLLWEFPGGKIEPGETAEECIVREIREELGVTLKIHGEFYDTVQEHPDRVVHLHFFSTKIASGELTPLEHNAVAWVTQAETAGYEFCPADTKMLQENKLDTQDLLTAREVQMSDHNHIAADVQRGNVLVIGNSGVGKSTLINAVLGEDLAEVGWGSEGTTKELKIYESNVIAFRLIDSIGFEPTMFKNRAAISAVQKWSKESAKAGKQDTQINVIWFCIDGTSRKLFEKTLLDLSKATRIWPSVPVIVVITKSYSVPDRKENIEMVHNAFAKQKKHPVNLRGVVPVVASTYILNDSAFAPPEGITELIQKTNDLMPDGIRAASKDIGQFTLNRKRALAQGIVGAATLSAVAVGAVPMPFSDALILAPVETLEINMLAKTYGIKSTEENKRFLNSIIETGTIGVGAKAIIGALKAIPGIGLGVSVINAVIAGAIVAALGESSIYIFEQIYLGNKTTDDINWAKMIVDAKLTDSIIEKMKSTFEQLSNSSSKEDIVKTILSVFSREEVQHS